MSDFAPKQPVIVAALPMATDGLSILADAVERIYGTGDTMVSFTAGGNQLQITAPADGFGPRVRTPLPAESVGEGSTRSIVDDGDGLTVTFEDAQETIAALANTLRQWFTHAGGINYVTARFEAFNEPAGEFALTVRRTDKPTPEDLHLAAKDRVAALEAQLRANNIEPVEES